MEHSSSDTRTLGERAADAVARNVGSWRFVLGQNGLICLWMLLNITGWIFRWDPWPFLFLNIIMSWQAANTGPILQMSSNRQSAKDREQVDRIEKQGIRIGSIEEKLDAHIQNLPKEVAAEVMRLIQEEMAATQ